MVIRKGSNEQSLLSRVKFRFPQPAIKPNRHIKLKNARDMVHYAAYLLQLIRLKVFLHTGNCDNEHSGAGHDSKNISSISTDP